MDSFTSIIFQMRTLRLADALALPLSQWGPDSPELNYGFLVSRKRWGRAGSGTQFVLSGFRVG